MVDLTAAAANSAPCCIAVDELVVDVKASDRARIEDEGMNAKLPFVTAGIRARYCVPGRERRQICEDGGDSAKLGDCSISRTVCSD